MYNDPHWCLICVRLSLASSTSSTRRKTSGEKRLVLPARCGILPVIEMVCYVCYLLGEKGRLRVHGPRAGIPLPERAMTSRGQIQTDPPGNYSRFHIWIADNTERQSQETVWFGICAFNTLLALPSKILCQCTVMHVASCGLFSAHTRWRSHDLSWYLSLVQ